MKQTKKNILLLCAGIYVLALLGGAFLLIQNFNQTRFGLFFILITLGPVGRFFLLRHPKISAWLNRLDQ